MKNSCIVCIWTCVKTSHKEKDGSERRTGRQTDRYIRTDGQGDKQSDTLEQTDSQTDSYIRTDGRETNRQIH